MRVPACGSLCLLVGLLAACGSGSGVDDEGETGESGGTGSEQAGPDYSGCTLNGPYDCRGTECAADEDAVQWIALVEDEIATRGWSDRVWVISGETIPETDQVLIGVIQEVGWFRAWSPINGLKTNVNELEFRTDVGLFLDQIELPTSVVDHQELLDALADCHEDLVYDPCTRHRWDTSVRVNVTYMPEPNCQEDLVVFTMELGSGEVVCDLDPPEIGCG